MARTYNLLAYCCGLSIRRIAMVKWNGQLTFFDDRLLSAASFLGLVLCWQRYSRWTGTHTQIHTHTPFLTAIIPSEPGLAGCPLNSPSPFIPGLRILLRQAVTFHVILNTIPPGLFRASSQLPMLYNVWPSHYHLFVQHAQTISTYSFWSSNWLVPIVRVLWVLHFSSSHSA